MRTLALVLLVLVAVLSCSDAVAPRKNDECGGDEASLMQTHTSMLKVTSPSPTLVSEGTRQFRSSVTPYVSYAADKSEISNLPENYSHGQLFAYVPTTPSNSDLLVFLPGSWVDCSNYTQFLEVIAPTMMTVCLPYDNIKAVAQLCGSDDSCWYQKRLESVNGSFHGIAGNNILARLQSALEYLKQEDGQEWASYVGSAGLKIESMRFAGHSQGAGAAAMIGYQKLVARIVQFSGPCDSSPWFQLLTPATPVDRFFAFADSYDQMCPWDSSQVKHWLQEGIVTDSKPITWVTEGDLPSFDPATSQTVISKIPPPDCELEHCKKAAHDSTVLNKWVSPAVAPYAHGLWQQLVGV